MRTVRVYSEHALSAGTPIELAPEAARHLTRVLRMRSGDRVILFDGSGYDYPGSITALDKKSVVITTDEAVRNSAESELNITLWHGVCRGSRMDYVIQKATELGVAAIQPVLTERGVVKLNQERSEHKAEHWHKVAISAAEQSGRSRIPEVRVPRPLQQCLADEAESALRLLLHPGAEQSLSTQALGQTALTLLTGPEGGFSDMECAAAIDAGFQMAGLGPRILRSETAPVAALAIVQSVAGDLGSGGGE